MIKTPICELLGIEYPILQGGMAWVADASLASAVSNAGGLSIIAGMNSNGEQLRTEIRKCRIDGQAFRRERDVDEPLCRRGRTCGRGGEGSGAHHGSRESR